MGSLGLKYPKIEGVHSGLWVKLNKELELTEPIDLSFVPGFLWNNESSSFITLERVKEISSNIKTPAEFGTNEPRLNYDNKLNLYVYEIWNKTTQEIDSKGERCGDLEIIKLNALTGEVVSITNCRYGRIIIR